jgi:hypothetical protein
MLLALVPGLALTATELATEAGLALPTVSGYLGRLTEAGLVSVERQGRHCYFRLADPDVAAALEALLPLAARAGHTRTRTGPRDAELRRARSCYDHLAGDLAVRMLASLLQSGAVRREGDKIALTAEGRRSLSAKGIDVSALEEDRRPLCRSCLDWSERRHHLGGSLGAAPASARVGLRFALENRDRTGWRTPPRTRAFCPPS